MYSQARRQPKGSALVVALCIMALSTGMMVAMIQMSSDNTRSSDDFTGNIQSYYAARGASELAMTEFWATFKNQTAIPNFVDYMDSKYSWSEVSPSQDKIAADFGQGLAVKRADVTNLGTMKMGGKVFPLVRLYRRSRNIIGQWNLDVLVVAEAERDLGFANAGAQSSALEDDERTTIGEATWVGQSFTFSSPPNYMGLDYALLTKNITCTMCHMRVRNLNRIANLDTSKYNTFERVKVGTTNFLAIRPDSAYTSIEGTMYHRGGLENEQAGTVLPVSGFTGGRVFTADFNASSTTVKQQGNGQPVARAFLNETTDASGNPITLPAPRGNLYLNYPSATNQQTDGLLPSDKFPAPFPEIPKAGDNGRGNSRVDADEVAAAELTTAAYTNPTLPSTLRGGISMHVGSDPNSYTDTALPTTGQPADITGSTAGNHILIGTRGNPLILDGKVVVEGDVILKGYVQGTGQIYATGNVYILGDVKYANIGVDTANEQFGLNASTDPDPKKHQNLAGIIAGGNIVIGDYLSQVTHWNSGQTDFFNAYYEKADGSVGKVGSGSAAGVPEPGKKMTYAANKYLNPYTDLAGFYAGNKKTYGSNTYGTVNFANFIVEQLAVFNRQEYIKTLTKLPAPAPGGTTFYPNDAARYTLDNPQYDANYIPRYYSFYPYDSATPTTNPVLIHSMNSLVGSSYNGTYYDVPNNRWNTKGDPHTYDMLTDMSTIPMQNATAVAKKNVLSIHPNWIDPNVMLKIISSEESQRTTGAERRIDGLLYTNNAIFAVERRMSQLYNSATNTWSKVASKSGGYLVVNGAIIAPDLGVLVTGPAPNDSLPTSKQAFTVNYDPRVRDFLTLEQQDLTGDVIGSNINLWGVIRKGFVKGVGALPR